MNLGGNERKYLLDAFDSGWLTHRGSYEERFEKAFSKYVGLPALATSSGTGALHLALFALGVRQGDEVIVPALTFGATASVVLAVGAKPVFCDVDDKACLTDFRHLISRNTKAVMPVNLYGESVDQEIYDLAKDYGLKVIEDNCEGLGFVDPRGDVSCYSFYANKMITTGEGGMLVGNFGIAEQWRNGGFDSDYYHEVPGLNYRMTNLQAAIGLAQLERINELLVHRLKVIQMYRQFEGFGKWMYLVKTSSPKALQKHLGIGRPVFYPLPLTNAFKSDGFYPEAERIHANYLALPTDVTLEQAEKITGRIHEFFQLR